MQHDEVIWQVRNASNATLKHLEQRLSPLPLFWFDAVVRLAARGG